MIEAAETSAEADLDRLTAELLAATEAEPVPPRIRELALLLQSALIRRAEASCAVEIESD